MSAILSSIPPSETLPWDKRQHEALQNFPRAPGAAAEKTLFLLC